MQIASFIKDKNKQLNFFLLLSIVILTQMRINFEQIKTNRKFREIDSGFSDSGLGVRSYEQDLLYLNVIGFFRQNSLIG